MYKSEIKSIGDSAWELLYSEKMIVLFQETDLEEIKDISVIHKFIEHRDKLEIGDIVQIGSNSYSIISIGEKAKDTFSSIGHCTFRFTQNKDEKYNLPGEVILLGEIPEDIKVGDTIQIEKKESKKFWQIWK